MEIIDNAKKVSKTSGGEFIGIDHILLALLRTRKEIFRDDGSKVQFDNNAVVLTDDKGEPIGTRIFGPVTRELRTKGHTKIISLAPEVL